MQQARQVLRVLLPRSACVQRFEQLREFSITRALGQGNMEDPVEAGRGRTKHSGAGFMGIGPLTLGAQACPEEKTARDRELWAGRE